MLTAFPLTAAKGTSDGGTTVAHWNHLTYQQVSLQGSSKKGQWTCHTRQWFRLQLFK